VNGLHGQDGNGSQATESAVGPRADRSRAGKFAAIDIGSNSIHLLMAELLPQYAFRVLGRDKEMVRLGRGGYARHRLTPEAMDTALAALARFRKLALGQGIESIRAVATSAVREAVNGGDFIERVREELGLKVKVISGREEGRLVYLAVRHAADFGQDAALVLDLGGGSLEIVSGTCERMLAVESFKLGAARTAELFLRGDPPAAEELYALEQHVRVSLEPVREELLARKPARCIGTSGTIMALAELCARAGDGYPSGGVPGFRRDALAELHKRLVKRSAEQRLKMDGMDPRRVDQVVSGSVVVLGVMDILGIDRIEISDQALRDGIVLDYIERHRKGLLARQTWPDPRRRTVMHLAERCGWHEGHACQVARLALMLFDRLAPLHKLPEKYRELLEYAALLHDIGHHIGQERHHRHSEYLIRNGNLQGLSPEEIAIIAGVARYHRGRCPKKKDSAFRKLRKSACKAIRRLAALLRIAEALDRSQFGVVAEIAVEIGSRTVAASVRCSGDAELELWTARRRSDLFESEFGRMLEYEPVIASPSASGPGPAAAVAPLEKAAVADDRADSKSR
jgi:exopolyphosphatase/guanosine-5'-triphosphate,3'-diphosphate pyrophosphatase